MQSEFIARRAAARRLAVIGDGDAISISVAHPRHREIMRCGPSRGRCSTSASGSRLRPASWPAPTTLADPRSSNVLAPWWLAAVPLAGENGPVLKHASASDARPACPPSPSGPALPGEAVRLPPPIALPHALQALRFSRRQIELMFRARRELGEVFELRAGIKGGTFVSAHPDHARALFAAEPGLVPSLTAESPVRPIVGPGSVLTANEPAHMPRRKLLLTPPFMARPWSATWR
jgi:hypothetical protein